MGQEIIANTFPLLAAFLIGTTTPQSNFVALQSLTVQKPEKHIVWMVEKDETLSGIAALYYGGGSYWTTLWQDNQWVKDPDDIRSGWKLTLRKKRPSEPTPLPDTLAMTSQEPPRNPLQPSQTLPTTQPAPSAFLASGSPYDGVYQQAGLKYNVPWQVLYGLHLTETGLRNGAISNAGGTGAQGPMQFMPGTWSSYAVDGNGDGVADINNADDAIYTAAHFLATHGTLNNGLRSYGGNTPGILTAARARGFSQ